jgi:hypothetical protein
MVDWLRPHFAEENDIVDLFCAITDYYGLDQVNENRSQGSSGALATAATDGGKLRQCFAAN